MSHNTNAGAYRADTALAATFDIPSGAPTFVIRVIQLDYYVRSFRLAMRPSGPGFPITLFVAYSREALIAPVPRGDAGYHELNASDDPIRRFFLGDEEGPPYIWLANTGSAQLQVQFSYFPSSKRTGRAPMPSRRDLDFPTIEAITATVVPGI